MDQELAGRLRTLEVLGYVLECIADSAPGEAKSAMHTLTGQLAEDPKFQFEGSLETTREVALACQLFQTHGEDDRREASRILFRLHRRLWEWVMWQL